MSQSCDPHRANILIELGSFEETAGRFGLPGFDHSGRSRSSQFSYQVSTKVAVDTVGIFRYSLDWNADVRPMIKTTTQFISIDLSAGLLFEWH